MDEPLIIDEITAAVRNILNGRDTTPISLPPNCQAPATKELIHAFNQLLSEYQDTADYVRSISRGNLDWDPPKGRMKVLNSLKGIHSNLKHLAWQTHRVADGDYNQQVDFLGDFSVSFNKMTRQLKEAFEKIETQKMALEDSNRFLEELNKTDPLTGLGNRRAFDGAINDEWRRAERDKSPISLVMLDVDSFKKYNDGYGHKEGDECLRRVGGVVGKHVHRPFDLAARYGGEEFAVILSGTSAPGALIVAENIRLAVEGLGIPHEFSLAFGVVTVSVGVATVIPAVGEAYDSLIVKADKALYCAKEKGRNQVMAAAEQS